MAEKNAKPLTPFQTEMVNTAKQIVEYKTATEANVVAILYKCPDKMLDYNLSLDDFSNNVWKVYFEIARGLIYDEKKEVLDDITVGIYLEKHSKLKAKYNEYGGYNTIESAMGYIKVENLDGYVTELRKFKAIIKMCKAGFPVKDRLSEYMDMTLEEIYNDYEAFLNDIFANIDSDVKSYDISNGIHELIEELDEGTAIGLPYYDMPILTKETGGQYLGSITLLGGMSNAGKEQPVTEPVLTENGWIPMGEVHIGTKVFGRDGKTHSVTHVFPQGIKDVYNITFSDGSSTRCGLNHLWRVETKKQRYKNLLDNGNRHKVITLKDIIKDYKKERITNTRDGKKIITDYKYSIPLCEPINFDNHIDLPIDAYALGLLLGDGGFTQKVPTFTNAEDDLFEQLEIILHDMGVTASYHSDYKNHKQCSFVYRDEVHHNELTNRLRQLNLWGCDSRHKFIPEIYKYSSIENRAKILSGIINTDGCVESPSHTSINITTYSKQLFEDVVEIARSLGFKVTTYVADRTDENSTNKYEKEISYSIRICSNDYSLLNLSAKHKARLTTMKNKRIKNIVDIRYVGQEESQCIMLDSDEHLYITKDYIVTHNSTVARSTTLPSIIKLQERVVVMVNEDSIKKWQREMLVWICNNILKFDIQKHIVRDGKYSTEVKTKLHEAANWLIEKTQDHRITIIPFLQYQTAKAIKQIRKYAAMGVKYFILDTFKMDTGKVSSNSWLEMQQSMVAIKDTIKAEALNVHILITFQLEKGSAVMRYYTQNNIGLAKNIVDVASTCIMIRDIFDDEYTDGKRALQVYRLDGINKKSKIEVKLNRDKKYQLFFIVKNQEGAANSFQIVAAHDKSRNLIEEVGITNIMPDGF